MLQSSFKIKLFSLLFTCVSVFAMAQKFDKAAFYAAMDRGNLEEVNNELALVTASSHKNKDGYEGALLMRKAGLGGRPAEKLKLFKAGRMKFDPAIANDPENAEFHFLRFAIQEHAPKIVKYNKELSADKQFIQKAYKNLSPVVQKAIMDYTKNSKILHPEDL